MYGEVWGVEHYYLFNERGDKVGFNYLPSFKSCWYDGHYYYIKQHASSYITYLWKSNKDGSKLEIIKELKDDDKNCRNIFVNHAGIYLTKQSNEESGAQIILLDFDGSQKSCLKSKHKLESYYICDNRIFTIIYDKEKNEYLASWYDTTTQTTYPIYSIQDLDPKIPRGKDKSGGSIRHIMANKDRVVMYLEFYNYCYSGNWDEVREDENGGWYSYDFQKKELECLDNYTEYLPHFVLTEPELIPKISDPLYWNQEWNYNKDKFRSIVAFDMENDIMWIRKMNGDDEIWEPKKIGHISEQKMIEKFPCWRVESGLNANCGRGQYFDGRYRYIAPETLNFYSYHPNGDKSENLYTSCYQVATNFFVCGEYLFRANGYSDQEYLYEKSLEPKVPIQENWMQNHQFKVLEQEDIAVKVFEQKSALTLPKTQNSIKKSSLSASLQSFKVTGNNNVNEAKNVKFSKLEYWQEFVSYAFETSVKAKAFCKEFPMAVPADRNWYALRIGTAKAHIELSFNTQKNTMRTALLIKDKDVFVRLERLVETKHFSYEMVFNRDAKTTHIGFMKNGVDFCGDRSIQFEWFMECASIFKHLMEEV